MSQLEAIFSGSSGSSRSERPRIWRTETPVVAIVRSTRQFTHGASQPSPSSARVPTSARVAPAANAARREPDPAPRPPAPGPRELGEAVASRPRRRSAAARRPRSRRARARRAARRRRARRSAARARRRAAAAAARCASRPRSPAPPRAPCRPRERGRRAARRRARAPASSPSHSTSARRPAPRASASPPSDLGQRERLRRRAVSTRSTSDAPRRMPVPGEREAEVAQRGGDRLAARGRRRGRRVGGEAAQRVVLDQHDPVVEVGRLAVAPRRAAPRAGARARPSRGSARRRAASARMAALEARPRSCAAVVLAVALAQPRDRPTARGRAGPSSSSSSSAVTSSRKRDVVLVEPALLARQRLGQPGELLVGREVAVAHDGRRRHREVDRPEQRRVQLGLVASSARPAASR